MVHIHRNRETLRRTYFIMEPLRTSINNSAINSKYYHTISSSRVLTTPLFRCDDQVIKQEIIDETDQNNDTILCSRVLNIPCIRYDDQVIKKEIKNETDENYDSQLLQTGTLCQFEEEVYKTEIKIKKEIDVINGFEFEGSVLTENHSSEFITRLNSDKRTDSRENPKPVSKLYEEEVNKTDTKIKKEIDVINGYEFEGSVLTINHSLEFVTRLNSDMRTDSREKPPKPVSKSYKNQGHKKVLTELNRSKCSDEILTSKVKIHNSKLEKSFVCYHCNKPYYSKSAIKSHMRTHTGERPYKCDICEQTFSRAGTLQIHTRTHTGEKPYKCDICDKGFISKTNLITHTRIHTGEKPFKCNICDKRFSSTTSLKRHERVHAGEKRFKCDTCKQMFSQLIHLKVHIRTHTGEQPYKCTICKRAFSHAANLKTHMGIHSIKTTYYKCEICDKGFANASNLSKHTRTHTGDKRYKCDVCDQMFSQSGNLKSHMRSHTGEKPYKCDICKRAYSRVYHLKIHTSKTHTK